MHVYFMESYGAILISVLYKYYKYNYNFNYYYYYYYYSISDDLNQLHFISIADI